MKKTKNIFKEYSIVIVSAIILAIVIIGISFTISSIIISEQNNRTEDAILEFSNSGGSSNAGVANYGSIIETTSGDYETYHIITSSPAYLERISIPETISGGGILLYNATANNLDAVLVASYYEPIVGSIEVGAYFDMGIMTVSSPSYSPSVIYTP